MGFHIMLKILFRRAFVPLVMVAQVVFALVVLVNVGSLLSNNLDPILAPTGVPNGEVLFTRIIMASNAGQSSWRYPRILAAEQAVGTIPGVIAVSAGLGAPFDADGMVLSVRPTAVQSGQTSHADLFSGDHVVDSLGLHLLRGRGFGANDYIRGGFGKLMSGNRAALITESLAQQLSPDGHAIGMAIRMTPSQHGNGQPLRVIGVVGNTLRSQVMENGPSQMDDVVITSFHPDGIPFVAFTVRAEATRRDAVEKRLPIVLSKALGIQSVGAVIVSTYEDVRSGVMRGHELTAWMLAAILGVVAVVALLGIAGLSNFWMQTRVHAIGVRRALGATRTDVMRDCHLENLIIVGGGVLIGEGIGLLAAAWLRGLFELGAPSSAAWIVGALVVLAIGQLAVVGTALRASRVSPISATRSL